MTEMDQSETLLRANTVVLVVAEALLGLVTPPVQAVAVTVKGDEIDLLISVSEYD